MSFSFAGVCLCAEVVMNACGQNKVGSEVAERNRMHTSVRSYGVNPLGLVPCSSNRIALCMWP